MKKKTLLITWLCYILFFVSTCNIFDWTTSSDEDVFYEGLKLFNQKKFTEAKEKFAEAMESDPYRSDYRYYHAKALVFESNLNFFSIARRIINIDTATVTGLSLPLYTREEDMTIEEDIGYKNSIYQVTWISHEDVFPIYLNKTHGEIEPDDIFFEFAILSLARAILQMRDTNNDLIINQNDLYFKITKVYNPRTDEYIYLPNLPDIYDYLIASDENRNGFNEMLANSATYSKDGIEALSATFTDTTLFDNADLQKLIQNIEDMSNLYQVGDGIDNDDDGQIDEEALDGFDDDGDGLVDEDSHL